ncbi:MAG TPA: DUF433 domain-containing protein [Myxococcales bacterium]|jgi:uncharacterized protein (DUF433 family)|nr:DUF433 domain-containing protein [Myxococcales bacterium]
MRSAETFTVAEVAALAGLEEGRVRKEVEHGFMGRATPPRFGFADLVYFDTVALLDVQFGVDDRRKLYGLISAALAKGERPARVEMGPVLEIRLDRVTKDAERRLARFESWKRKLITSDRLLGGETVFPKSRLAVRRIGGLLLRAGGIEEVREDYPYLTEEDLEFAPIFVRAYPRMGRPRES